ncbi:DUF5403 family protein [Mycolicibacterium houstonense]|uniref:DUF5403 family protein n=1 Tax=Mycolicibacterium houstonense TaxID=146021 RepID=UPI00093EB897|nr:DUF5403 family protein [Mycolicibacterium houstonense]
MAHLYYGRSGLNKVIAHMPGVRDAIHDEAKQIGRRAESNLAQVRASTRWHKIYGPDHLTRITVTQGSVDAFANLEAPGPEAIEFGHAPSGVFEGTDTRAPAGLYILTGAAGFARLAHSSSGLKRGKR